MFINAAATISHQPTFGQHQRLSQLQKLTDPSNLITPDYSVYIPAMERRRMSQVQKMSIACALDCISQSKIEQPDAIIVGTSMGCSVNTRTFLDRIYQADEGPLSPTSFIVSTHNTIAGQIALILKNHGYNMTHTQNSLSFEHALLDAMLCEKEGCTNILVGGTDEEERAIYNMPARLHNYDIHLGSGASFFIISNKAFTPASVELVNVGCFGLVEKIPECIFAFLDESNMAPSAIDLVLFAVNQPGYYDVLRLVFQQKQLINYQDITGTYYTNPAFAMHYGMALLQDGKESPFGVCENILICNNMIPGNLGLILLRLKK
jgi:3-oxoacyl-[acyl-carrier-protein] synthase II